MAIKTVWIEEGCIMCNACESTCPDVFLVGDSSSTIQDTAREDHKTSENRNERSPLKHAFQTSLEADIEAAANGCPVEVIKFEKL